MILSVLRLALCGASLCAPPALLAQGLTATVSDPLSHGQIADAALSLDEAIQLANGTLAPSTLSSAERAQLTGNGSTVDRIEFDQANAATITLQAALTPIAGGSRATRLVISGSSTTPAPTVLLGGNQPAVITLRSTHVRVEGFEIVGGQIGLDAQMADSGTPVPDLAELADCTLRGQSQSGVMLRATGSDQSTLMMMRTRFESMPIGLAIDDSAVGGKMLTESDFISMDGVAVGIDVTENGDGPPSAMRLFRSEFLNGETLLRVRRGATSTRRIMLRLVHTNATCTGDVVDVQGSANGSTVVHHHHGDFVAGPGRKAFSVWPRTGEFDVHGSEMLFDGDVMIAGNPFTSRVWQQNNHYRGSNIVLDVDGALPNLLWNVYENCTIDIPSSARSPVVVRASELANTTVRGGSAFAPVQLSDCWRSGGSLAGFATESRPAQSRFLGNTAVAPASPSLGGSLTLSADLPPGVGLVWSLMLTEPRPATTAEPVRIYGIPEPNIALPGVAALRSQITIPMPSDPGLLGIDFYLQGISVPLFGGSHIPAYHLPRGTRVMLQR